ncbi:MAG: DUF6728 family protein [Cyclobacteriaceae bacterium]
MDTSARDSSEKPGVRNERGLVADSPVAAASRADRPRNKYELKKMIMQNEETDKTEKKMSFKDFFSLGEVGNYFFRKKDPNRPSNINIKMMHGVNKLSIAIFLLAVLYLIVKRLF